MSKMAELGAIEDLWNQGHNVYTIATMLNVPVNLVDSFVAYLMDVEYNESMDGDI